MKTNTLAAFLTIVVMAMSQILPLCAQPAAKASPTPAAAKASPTPASTASPTPAAAASPTPAPAAKDKCTINVPTDNSEGEAGSDKVKFYYLREAVKIKDVLVTLIPSNLCVSTLSDDELILYGTAARRRIARRMIAVLDLPRPGINLEMWGIQISSPDPDKMARVMIQIREIISQTQADVRETYRELQKAVLKVIPDNKLDAKFKTMLTDETGLSYGSALDANRTLSITDILIRMIAADKPDQAAVEVANKLDEFGKEVRARRFASWNKDPKEQKKRKAYLALLPNERRPFERFFRLRGLTTYKDGWTLNAELDSVKASAYSGRAALLDFALNYAQLVHEPNDFSPYHLQRSAGVLNDRLQNAIDALNADMEDLFLLPTLIKIQALVADFKDVDYAQVGKTSAASLSGVQTKVTSKAVSAFDVTPPLTLSEWLTKAGAISDSVAKFDPAENVVGALPLAKVIGLAAAFSEQKAVWRELNSGVSIAFTPNVLRNMASAELKIKLETGDPQSGTREEGVRPLSRVSQHDVETSVYVNGLDFFDLSAFNSQSTINGGRGYVPIVGTIWRGVFSDIPIFGNLFSWKKGPKSVYHESLILTNAFITPTAMGVAVLYPLEPGFDEVGGKKIRFDFSDLKKRIDEYTSNQK